MSTYIVHKTREWSLKHQSLSLPDSATYKVHKTREWSPTMSTYIVQKIIGGVVSETPKPIIAR